MKHWTPTAAKAATVTACFWAWPCGTMLQLAAEEAARRNGHAEVTEHDWENALRDLLADGTQAN